MPESEVGKERIKAICRHRDDKHGECRDDPDRRYSPGKQPPAGRQIDERDEHATVNTGHPCIEWQQLSAERERVRWSLGAKTMQERSRLLSKAARSEDQERQTANGDGVPEPEPFKRVDEGRWHIL
jgi:hypothetical protein